MIFRLIAFLVFTSTALTTTAAQTQQCPATESALPPLFTVLENTAERITVDFGDFEKAFGGASDGYKYKVIFRGSKENRNTADELIASGHVGPAQTRLTIPVHKTGIYLFSIFEKENSPVWTQKVFSISNNEIFLSEATKEELARKYAPVVNFHNDERYFPVSLEYLTNQVDPDPALAEEPFRLVAKKSGSFFSIFKSAHLDISFKFKDLLSILPFYGHSNAVLKSGLSRAANTALKRRYGNGHATVYYSIFENPRWKEIYINYHFFYTYDSKNGTETKDALPAHIFDRESMTVVLRSTSLQPLMVFYGAHLPNQTMGQLNKAGRVLQKWQTGRVYVNWPLVNKIGDRPVPAVALGSHGIYPKEGLYAVLAPNDMKLLLEPAGGTRVLYPEFIENFDRSSDSHAYKLENLNIGTVTSDCRSARGILAFSGSTVDVLGPTNASFPPFTDREEDYFSYADPNAPMFDMNLN